MARFNRSSMFPSTAGARRTTSIVGPWSTAGYTPSPIDIDSSAVATLSGALTANTLKTLFNLTSVGGRITKLAIKTNDAVARTIRVVITVDGSSVYDFTSASTSLSGVGACFAGKIRVEAANYLNGQPDITFTTSCKVEYASNNSETDKFTLYHIYNTES